jgi:hypothetical protein
LLADAYRRLHVVETVLCGTDAPREERDLVSRIREVLNSMPELKGDSKLILLSVHSALEKEEPLYDPERRIPLTW